MIMTIIIMCIAFFLDGLLSIYQNISLFEIIYFRPLFTIVALSLVYLWYFKNHKSYYKTCLFTGLAYDLLYTNTFPLNTLLFILIGLINQKIYSFFRTNLMNGAIINLIIITTYYIVNFAVLFLIGYLPLEFSFVSHDFLGVIITNSMFYIMLYIIFRRDKQNRTYGL